MALTAAEVRQNACNLSVIAERWGGVYMAASFSMLQMINAHLLTTLSWHTCPQRSAQLERLNYL